RRVVRISFQDGTICRHKPPVERRAVFAILFENRKIADWSFVARPPAGDGRLLDPLAVLQNPGSLSREINLNRNLSRRDGSHGEKTENG
ncbi:MAG TPA: hypothetical protein VFD27_13350, partial [Chthoniobacteraceae bacterium]|nr:hypothetical protein [Chthoniobacteraceae bacterium]